jgi:glyoxylase-like metal-dependent hydrolase (beta-lactamase superfamily II)
VRLEVDDPTGDWTRAGVFEVAPSTYRIPLPLPDDGLHAVNVYALTDDTGVTIVDGGWALPEARALLEKALGALDRSLGDVRRFLVTHVHRDHYSLAVMLRRELGTPVSLGAGERVNIESLADPAVARGQRLGLLLFRLGAADMLDALKRGAERTPHDPAEWAGPDDWLDDGATLALPDRRLRVVATPGHTRGHVVFADADAGVLFTGDHVLPHITPSIGFEPVPAVLPLGDFLDSLRLVRELPDHRLFPAHGPVRPSVHARVDELLDHHGRRLDEACAAVGGDMVTAYQTAQRMTWTRHHRTFAELDRQNQMLSVMETAAHLDLLVAQGRLGATELDGVRLYRADHSPDA